MRCCAMGVFVVTFLVSTTMLIRYFVQSREQDQEYSNMAGLMESLLATAPSRPVPTQSATRPTTPPPTETAPESSVPTNPPTTVPEPSVTVPEPTVAPTQPPVTDPPVTEPLPPVVHPDVSRIMPQYLPFYQKNADMVGWIQIPDTKVNYPVMQTPNNPDYYLKRNFDRIASDWGAIYVRESCDVFTPSDNQTIYGHHMKDGSMFAGLLKYKTKSYWETHKYIHYDTLYEYHTYEIFAVFKTSADIGKGYPYHRFENAATQEEFDNFVSSVKGLSFYDTGITPTFGDKLIALSTCEYTLNNGRFVVVARRIS